MKKSDNLKNFSIDARTIIHLGRDSIKNPTTALLELVKNSYDADATLVSVELEKDFIRISDNGIGMTQEDITEGWLRIGYSQKRVDKNTSKTMRRKTGEKGIGRLSSDRLGALLDMRSRTHGSKEGSRLQVNWDDFDVDGKDLSSVDVRLGPTDDFRFSDNSKHGTEIIINSLRQKWSLNDIEQAYEELVSLVSPFREANDFTIIFNNYLSPELNGPIESQYFDVAELSLNLEYLGEGNKVKYQLNDRTGSSDAVVSKEIAWNQLSQHLPKTEHFDEELRCGPVTMQILFYQRTKKNPLLEEKGLTMSGLREFLDNNIGIKIYRDNVSVKPYGYNNELAGDWLGLARRKERDPAGLNRPTYKIASSQLVGAISIGRDTNPQLHDGASREGFVENGAFFDLRALVLSAVTVLEQYRHGKALASSPESNKKPVVEEVDDLTDDIDDIKNTADKLKDQLVASGATKETLDLVDDIEEAGHKASEKTKRVEELIDQNRALSGLATVGISAAVFGHETQTAISLFKGSVDAARSKLTLKKGADVESAIIEIDESVKYADQVNAWGAFGLTRVRRDKRTKRQINVKQVVESIMHDISHSFKMFNINVETDLEEVHAKSFVMDLESIILNLMTNAYWACAQNGGERKIKVTLRNDTIDSKNGFTIEVIDNGPGIDEDTMKLMWQPLFTNKKDGSGREIGTGLGLSIVSSTVSDLGGQYGAEGSSSLGGAKFNIWLPKE